MAWVREDLKKSVNAEASSLKRKLDHLQQKQDKKQKVLWLEICVASSDFGLCRL